MVLHEKDIAALIAEAQREAQGPNWDQWHTNHCQPCTLSFPTGEVTNPGLRGFLWAWKMLGKIESAPLGQHEGFNAQGLEMKVIVRGIPLISAIIACRDLTPMRRQIELNR